MRPQYDHCQQLLNWPPFEAKIGSGSSYLKISHNSFGREICDAPSKRDLGLCDAGDLTVSTAPVTVSRKKFKLQSLRYLPLMVHPSLTAAKTWVSIVSLAPTQYATTEAV